jgi:hypothetical protein
VAKFCTAVLSASENFDAFIRFRSSPSQESVAENSSFKRSGFRGSDHWHAASCPTPEMTQAAATGVAAFTNAPLSL